MVFANGELKEPFYHHWITQLSYSGNKHSFYLIGWIAQGHYRSQGGPYWGGTCSPFSITSMKSLIWSRHIRKENEGSPSFRGNVKQKAIKNNKQWSYKDYHEIKLCLKHFLQVKTWEISRNLGPSFRE